MSDNHAHSHAPQDYGRAFAIGVTLNIVFVLAEALAGWRVGSLALLADAGHNLSDVGGLLLAWVGLAASRLRANERHTYGWRRASIMASLINAIALLVVMGSLALAAVQRFRAPAPIEGSVVMLVAGLGVAVNAVTAALFVAGKGQDLNVRGAYLHMAADALVSASVVVAGGIYMWTGWRWIDPAITLVIVIVVVLGTWSLFRQSLHLMFDGVPDRIDAPAVRAQLLALPEVEGVHDLHVWALSSSEVALSAHLVTKATGTANRLIDTAAAQLHERWGIDHVTLQVESPDSERRCASMRGVACESASPSG